MGISAASSPAGSKCTAGVGVAACASGMIARKRRKSPPARSIAAGNVSTQASAIFRMVDLCSPDFCAIIVPAMPDD